MITKEEKHEFAIYIEQMRLRVQACRDTVRSLLLELPADYDSNRSRPLLEKLKLT